MDRSSDESSSSVSPASPPSPEHASGVPQCRRSDAVHSLNEALAARGTVLPAAKLLWIAAEFEVEIHARADGNEAKYCKLLEGKLRDLGGKALFQGSSLPSASGVAELSWKKIQEMRAAYSPALQGSYVVLVSTLQRDNVLGKDSPQLKTLKRLILGLVLFLSAEQERIPGRFTLEKLSRLEKEVVKIMTAVLAKIEEGALEFKNGEEKGRLVKELRATVEKGRLSLAVTADNYLIPTVSSVETSSGASTALKKEEFGCADSKPGRTLGKRKDCHVFPSEVYKRFCPSLKKPLQLLHFSSGITETERQVMEHA